MANNSVRIDGSVVRFWALKRDAMAAAKSIGWPASEVWAVHTRFAAGFAIHDFGSDAGFLTRDRFGELFAARRAPENAALAAEGTPMARKKKAPKRITVTYSPEQAAEIEREAKKAGVSVAEYLRTKDAHKPLGRPTRAGAAADVRKTVRYTADEAAEVEAAVPAGKSVAEWIRELTLASARRARRAR